jgi:hypothetical protein
MARSRLLPPPLPPIPSVPGEFDRVPDFSAAATGPRDLAIRMMGSEGAGGGTKVLSPDPFLQQ